MSQNDTSDEETDLQTPRPSFLKKPYYNCNTSGTLHPIVRYNVYALWFEYITKTCSKLCAVRLVHVRPFRVPWYSDKSPRRCFALGVNYRRQFVWIPVWQSFRGNAIVSRRAGEWRTSGDGKRDRGVSNDNAFPRSLDHVKKECLVVNMSLGTQPTAR